MAEAKSPDEEKSKLKFHYIKSNLYRVVHVDGAWGGLTPRLGVFVALYSERPPIPQVSVYEVNERGTLGDEIKEERQSKDGIVREAEIGISMDLEVAKSLVLWLQDKIQQAENMRAAAEHNSDQTTTAGREPGSVH